MPQTVRNESLHGGFLDRRKGATMTQQLSTDARQLEYVTYAPVGYKCPQCHNSIKPLERAVRIATDRSSAGPALQYRHWQCP